MKLRFSVVVCFLFLGLITTQFLECKETEQSLANEAGFMAIEPIPFHFHYGSYASRLELTSSDARIWYSFHAADENSTEKPLFVFFNGGPGGHRAQA